MELETIPNSLEPSGKQIYMRRINSVTEENTDSDSTWAIENSIALTASNQ
jgi:hypothetical protein